MIGIYLHGYRGNASEGKLTQIGRHLGIPVLGLEYSPEDISESSKAINSLIEEQLKDDEVFLIGKSLGALSAMKAALKYELKLILINPCIQPNEAKVEGLTVPEKEYENILTEYQNSNIESHVYLSTDDEVVDHLNSIDFFTGKSKIFKYNNCGHIFSQISQISHSKDMLNTIVV